jgi:tetratricopeptide (TPR) repeat protein
VSPRARVYAIVAGACAAAAGGVVAITAATHTTPPKPPPPRGAPQFLRDPTAAPALARQVRAATGAWPHGTIPRLRRLAAANPRSGFVRVNLGLALYSARQDSAAVRAWHAAERVAPDTPSAVVAQTLLHPDLPPGLPFFVPEEHLDPRAAPELLRGIAFQRAGRPVSAERAFAAAARSAPDDPQAQVAAALGRYTKDHPERAFSRLGPLLTRFPHAQTVRFHLGLLSIFIRDFAEARRQLTLARAEGPGTRLGTEAKTLLASLVRTGTS